MTNEEKATMIANQCKPCTDEFYSGAKYGALLALNNEKLSFQKAKKYDELTDKITKFYEDNADGNLCDIGEITAIHYGFL